MNEITVRQNEITVRQNEITVRQNRYVLKRDCFVFFTGVIKDSYDKIIYSKDGRVHREDGPAVIYPNGDKYYYLNDKMCVITFKIKKCNKLMVSM